MRTFVIARLLGIISWGNVVWSSFHISFSFYEMNYNHALRSNKLDVRIFERSNVGLNRLAPIVIWSLQKARCAWIFQGQIMLV